MKRLLPVILLLWVTQVAGQAFITTWNTGIPGISAQNQITIPTTGPGYSYSIYWEEDNNPAVNGTIPGPITGNYTITFPSAGVYRVSITGDFPRIFFNEQGDHPKIPLTSDAYKIQTIEQWGDILWSSMAHAFQGCFFLKIMTLESPNLSQVTDMSYMFKKAELLNNSIGLWNVSSVKNMSHMFDDANYFNKPLETWDVSNVSDMSWMFFEADNFNQPLGNWDVSHVTDMSSMFKAAYTFNQPIESWDVSSVKTMGFMFNEAYIFNQPLGSWDVSGVTDMNSMFFQTGSFNQPIGTWDVGNVYSMNGMLSYSGLDIVNYDRTLIGWATQNVMPNVDLGAIGLKYCAGEAARTQLIATKDWDIVGDSKDNALPSPVVSVTQPLCQGNTGTITVTTQNSDYLYSFDAGSTFQVDNVKSGLTPGTYSIIIKSSLGCISAPSLAVINSPLRSPAPIVSGSHTVCPNVLGVDYDASIEDYTYTWLVDGGLLRSQENDKIKVDWGPTNFSASVKVLGYDKNSCPTDTATFPVKIQIKLHPGDIQGMDSVCYNFRTGVPYQTSYTNGSVYTWFTDGGTVSEGQTTSKANIGWPAIGQYHLWVKEENTTSTDYCEGYSDTLNITVFKDTAAITLNFVSVDYRDDQKVQIAWDATLLERISDLIIISRRTARSNELWKIVATLQKNVQSFLDQNVQTDKNIYEYKVEGFNKCDEGLQTVIHNTIKLDGDKDEEQELIDLFWNDYNGWEGVERYEIWRKLDSDTTYRLVDVTAGEITSYIGKHGADGFVHLLRVKAKKKNENTISWSNEIELDFDHTIEMIPNIITPDGDLKNEYFVIPKLNLYANNYLTIYNRWGETVYTKRNYTNDWNANGLYNGIYYYTLYLDRNRKTLKGWVQVVR